MNSLSSSFVYVRVYLSIYFPPFFQIDFIFEAVALVAEDGWRLLPQYNFTKTSGEWFHVNNFAFMDRKCLSKVSYLGGEMDWKPDDSTTKTAFVLNDAILKVKEGMK